MKKAYKYLSLTALSAMVSLTLTFNANAQHQRGGGGGGGGGGGHSSPQPASQPAPQRSAPAQSYSRPAPSQSYSRPASAPRTNNSGTVRSYNSQRNGGQRVGVTQQRNFQNGRVGIAPRPGTNGIATHGVSGRNYRSYQGSVYGHNHPGYSGGGVRVSARVGYLPGRAAYHYNRGYYNSYYGPRLGFSVGFLPYGYYPFYFDDYQYFYSGGLFYQYNDNQYTVVEPPVGAEITTLPSNAQSIVINGQQYYEVNGVYYEPITKDDGTLSYQVAGKDGELNTDNGQDADNAPQGPQIGDIVSQLPPNCRKISINGEKLYLSQDGIYYKAQLDQDSNKVYKIVGLPEDQDQGQQDQQDQDN
jgi:hypothetical protein